MLLILIVSSENMYTNLPQCAELYGCEKLRKSIQNIDKVSKTYKNLSKKGQIREVTIKSVAFWSEIIKFSFCSYVTVIK